MFEILKFFEKFLIDHISNPLCKWYPFIYFIPQSLLTDVIQLSLTLKMTTAQVFKTSVIVNNNSPIQDYVHPDYQTQPTFEMTPGFKTFT